MLAHPHTWIFFALIFDALCAVVLVSVAEARSQSRLFGLWALLGFAGLVAGLLIMLALPATPGQSPPMQPSA